MSAEAGVDPLLRRVADEFGTPAYVYLGDRIEARIGELNTAFGGRFTLSYAAKSNPNPTLLGFLEPRVEKVALEGTVLSYLEMARARYHEDLVASFVPGVLKDFDLPDLAAALAPRVLWIVDPRTPTKAPVSVERTHREYEPTLRAYERAGRSDAFRVLHRPEAWPMEKIYSDWLDSR